VCISKLLRNQNIIFLLQEDLGTDYQIAYIDIKEGDKTGCIRMKDEVSAKRLTEAPSGSYFFTLLKGQCV